jgi:phage repressor protein C with HTH and peptisase S24 domain
MSEKQLLNDRFKIIFRILEENGDFVKNSRDKGMASFAEKILGNRSYGHVIRACLKKDNLRTITYAQAKNLVKHFGVSEVYLFRGEGPVFSDGNEPDINTGMNEDKTCLHKPDENRNENQHEPQKNILFSSVSAFASRTFNLAAHEDTERFFIPRMGGEHIAFYIKGNSMSPTIEDGDMIICRAVETCEPVNENKIYAIVLKNGTVLIKRVQKLINKHKQMLGLKLISDNYLEHDPFEIPVNDVRKLLKVERKLTDAGF